MHLQVHPQVTQLFKYILAKSFIHKKLMQTATFRSLASGRCAGQPASMNLTETRKLRQIQNSIRKKKKGTNVGMCLRMEWKKSQPNYFKWYFFIRIPTELQTTELKFHAQDIICISEFPNDGSMGFFGDSQELCDPATPSVVWQILHLRQEQTSIFLQCGSS